MKINRKTETALVLMIYAPMVASLMLPFAHLPLGPINIRIEDMFGVIALPFSLFLIFSHAYWNRYAVLLISFIILSLLWGIALRPFHELTHDNYQLPRAIGVLVFIVGLSPLFLMRESSTKILLATAALCGTFTSTFFLVFAATQISAIDISSIYSLKHAAAPLTSLHINSMGALATFSAFSCLAYYRLYNNKIFLLFSLLCIAFIIVYLIRREIAGFIIATLYLVFVSGWISKESKAKISVILGIFSILFIALLPNFFLDAFRISFETGAGLAGRDTLVQSGLDLLKNNPAGYGWGSQEPLLRESYNVASSNFHNAYLAFAVELGLPILFLFLGILLYLFKTAREPLSRYFIIVIAVASLFGNGLFFYKLQWINILFIILYLHILNSKRVKLQIEAQAARHISDTI